MSDVIQNLKAAAAQHQRAVAEKLKIGVVLNRPAEHIGSMPDMQGAPDVEDIDAIRLAYEAAAADFALGVGTEDGANAAKIEFEAAKTKQQNAIEVAKRAEAVNSGLLRKLAAANEAVQEAKKALTQAEGEYVASALRAADAEYVEAVQQIAIAHKRVLACNAALRARGLHFPPGKWSLGEHFPIGPVSAAAALEANPSAPHGYGQKLFWQHNLGADTAALEAEITSLVEEKAGPLARVINALIKAPAKAGR